MAIAPDHVVVRVKHDLACQLLHGHVVDDLEGDGNDCELTSGSSAGNGCGTR
jgi:hypothetical protein